MITAEKLSKMALDEKVNQHAKDVMKTENNPEYLQLQFTGYKGQQEAKYPAGEGEFIYSFLFGGGSLGHPHKPSNFGKAVYNVARLTETTVAFLDFTYARFNKKINTEAIEKSFYPIFEESERLKAEEKAKKILE